MTVYVVPEVTEYCPVAYPPPPPVAVVAVRPPPPPAPSAWKITDETPIGTVHV